jgi:hypothetical protein
MAVGDKMPDNVHSVGSKDGCTLGSDGHWYNDKGYQIETDAERAEREREEAASEEAARRAAAEREAYRKIIRDGEQQISNAFKSAAKDSLKEMADGYVNTATTLAGMAGAATYAAELCKDPNDPNKAAKRGVKAAGGVIGIFVIIAFFFALCVVIAMFPSIPYISILFYIYIVVALIGIIGCIRLIIGRTFFISIKSNPNAKPIPFWGYIIVELVSAKLLYTPIHNAIQNNAFRNNPDLSFLQAWKPSEYQPYATRFFVESFIISVLGGIVICLLAKFMKKRL